MPTDELWKKFHQISFVGEATLKRSYLIPACPRGHECLTLTATPGLFVGKRCSGKLARPMSEIACFRSTVNGRPGGYADRFAFQSRSFNGLGCLGS